MRTGILKHKDCKAYWLQIWKIRIGFFVAPLGAMWCWQAKKCYDLGWAICFGPFQVCYYRYAMESDNG